VVESAFAEAGGNGSGDNTKRRPVGSRAVCKIAGFAQVVKSRSPGFWPVGRGRLFVVRCQLSVVSGQWSVVSGQWFVLGGALGWPEVVLWGFGQSENGAGHETGLTNDWF
jgi:hypothetical protein